MLENIKAHSFVVTRVAELLTREFIRKGRPLDLNLVIAAALLHDIAKTQCLEGKCDHAKVGGEICVSLNFKEVAEIVQEHVLINSNGDGRITEKEIVYYSDKRVNHDKIVSLHERLEYILDRYGKKSEFRHISIEKNFQKCLGMEERMFADLDFLPADVSRLVASNLNWSV